MIITEACPTTRKDLSAVINTDSAMNARTRRPNSCIVAPPIKQFLVLRTSLTQSLPLPPGRPIINASDVHRRAVNALDLNLLAFAQRVFAVGRESSPR